MVGQRDLLGSWRGSQRSPALTGWTAIGKFPNFPNSWFLCKMGPLICTSQLSEMRPTKPLAHKYFFPFLEFLLSQVYATDHGSLFHSLWFRLTICILLRGKCMSLCSEQFVHANYRDLTGPRHRFWQARNLSYSSLFFPPPLQGSNCAGHVAVLLRYF